MIDTEVPCNRCGKPWSPGHANECTGQKPKRGRPPSPGGPQTAAQRQAARRERLASTIGRSVATLDDTSRHIERLDIEPTEKQAILMALALIAQDLDDFNKM